MATNAEIYQSVTDRIIQALEGGCIPWRKPWSGGGANTHRNAISGKPYRGGNIWLLILEKMLRGFTDNRWLTFKQAMAAKGKFKGEKGDDIRKGTQVILWKPLQKVATDAQGNAIIKNGKEVVRTYFFLRTFTVFNVEQFEGLNIKEVQEPAQLDPHEEAEAIWEGYTSKPLTTFGFDHACYYPSSDKMEMPDRSQFGTIEEYYSTLFHEATHSTGHKSRLDRPEIQSFAHFGDQNYSQEELVAEMGAAFLCAHAGIDTTLDNSAAYLAHWIQVLKEDNKIVLSAAGKAQRAVDHIMGTTFVKEDTSE